MVTGLVDLQQALTGSVEDLCIAGLPDWRAPALLDAIDGLCRRDDVRATLTAEEASTLNAVVDGLPARFAAIDECAIDPTLVHGDFHPGNWRGGPERLVLLDWGDSGVGHPLLDMPAFLDRMPPEFVPELRRHWAGLHAGDAQRASALVAPIAALRQALVYRAFLDGIEPAERRYHEADVPLWLREAMSIWAQLPGAGTP
jgi:hypothetical protein